MRTLAFTVLTLSLLPCTALAQPTDERDAVPLFDGEICMPVEDMADMVAKMDALDPEKRDTVALRLEMAFDPEDGESLPDRVEVRNGDAITIVPIDADGHTTTLLDTIRSVPETASACIVDPARTGRPMNDLGMGFSIGMRVGFIDTPGAHTLDEIEDGLKDGRSHYKKMAGAMGFMVPKFRYVAVANDADEPPRLFGTRDGVDLGEPPFDLYDGARLVSIKELEKMGADGIRVEGPYRMSPSPDAKTVARFSGGGD